MTSLSNIPVRVEGRRTETGPEGGLGGGVLALLQEIVVLLERLNESGQPGAIDLRSMPMIPGDRRRLQAALGDGEVDATVDCGGTTRVRETDVTGVWWVEHRGEDERIIAEMIEVAEVPELLRAHRDDIAKGAERLRERLTAESTGAASSE